MTPTLDPQAMSEDWQKLSLQYMKESSNGGSPSPELVQTLNSRGFVVGQEKFRATCMAARHNQTCINHVNLNRAMYKAQGEPLENAPFWLFHPMLWMPVEQSDGFGGTDWVCVEDKRYEGGL